MAKYELTKEWTEKNAAIIKKGYSMAISEGHDINSEKDVLKILRAIDPENTTLENAKIFSKILQLFSQRLQKKFMSPRKVKAKIIN